MATFTLVTNRRSCRPNKGYSRPQVRPQQTMPTSRDDFRRQFPTHHDAENHYAAPAAAAPNGAWARKLRVNASASAEVRNSRPTQKPSQSRMTTIHVANKLPCAYCKEYGHHIRYCEKAAAATAKKQEWKRKEKARRATERQNLAEERLRQRVLAAQQAKILAQQPVVEEESDSSDSDYEEQPETSLSRDDQIAELLAELAELQKSAENASWADAADIDDEIDDLEEKLADLGYTPEERKPEVSFQSRLIAIRSN
tara:strand:+ start:1487 stop:2251 length:765 start_codon:yes stop_codon:yes gene_type:complete